MKISAEYLQTLQYRIDIIANNIANVNTPGFKEGLLFIEETYNTQERSNNVALYGGLMPGIETPDIDRNMYVGKRVDFRQGALYETGNPLDMAIFGEGFFQVSTPDGKIGYSRAGLFTVDAQRNLVNNEGMLVQPRMTMPDNVSEISVKTDGTIKGVVKTTDGDTTTEEVVDIGQVTLFNFSNPEGLEQLGHNIFLPTDASGPALEGTPGTDGLGTIQGGMLERSNTDIVNAMTKMIEAQRAYQFDMRIAKDQDEMMMQAIAMRG